MKTIFIISTVFLLILLGCESSFNGFEEEVVGGENFTITALKAYKAKNPSQIILAATGNRVERPYKVKKASGIIRIIAPSDVCEFAEVRIEGSGQGTHVGRFDVVNRYCVDAMSNPIPPITGTITAANGDSIYVVLTGSTTNSMGISTLNYIIVGGSGRFEGAGGGYILVGIVDETNLIWSLEGEGTIIF